VQTVYPAIRFGPLEPRRNIPKRVRQIAGNAYEIEE
jgi:hypothetical protein